MEEGAKRRLVGAAVIVLLLVVFLPMLLEEDLLSPVPDGGLVIPPRPDVERVFNSELATPPLEPAPLPPELPPPALRVEAPPPVAPVSESKAPESAPEAQPEPEPAARRELVEKPNQTPQPPPPPVRTPAPAGLSTWVIQVAALTELPRARALEKDLRAKSFPAFLEQAEVRGKTYYRVRVGPEADRKRIDSMAASLRDKMGLEGQIQRYP